MLDKNGHPRSALSNAELLASKKGELRGLDGQRAYLLKLASVPLGCPACGGKHTKIEASGVPFEEYNAGYASSECVCPTTGIAMHHWLGLFAGEEGFALKQTGAELLQQGRAK